MPPLILRGLGQLAAGIVTDQGRDEAMEGSKNPPCGGSVSVGACDRLSHTAPCR
jgi:hypothetical protein